METIIPLERIEKKIFLIRRQKIMLDADLTELYGVPTKALNQAVKRNKGRFPADFLFRLNKREKEQAVTVCDQLKKLKFSTTLPFAFTEHGALMMASVLNSQRAIEVSVYVIRAFAKLREMLSTHHELGQKLVELEGKIQGHDSHIRSLFEAIRQLMALSPTKVRRIGFELGLRS